MNSNSARRDGDAAVLDTAVIRLRDGSVVWRMIDGRVVALDLDDSVHLNLNESGSVIWSLIAVGATRNELVDELFARFEVSREQADKDVDAFVRTCADKGLLDT